MSKSLHRQVEQHLKRHWNEALHPRDDRGRFTRKGLGGQKWVARVLAQSRLDITEARASTKSEDVDRFFHVAAGMKPSAPTPKRAGPGPVITLDRPGSPHASRIRKTANVYDAAPGTGVDAQVARKAAPRLDRIADDVDTGKITPKQAAGRVRAIQAEVSWRPDVAESSPLAKLAEDLEGGPRPVARPNPATAGFLFGNDDEVARVAAELPDDDLRAPALPRSAYRSDVALLKKMTAGPSAGNYTDKQRTATAERLLAAREGTAQGGDDRQAQVLRGMLDFWNGYGYSAKRRERIEAQSPARGERAPVVVERPEKMSWGKSRNVLPQAMTPSERRESVTPVDTQSGTRKAEEVATQPKLTKKQIKALHRFDQAGQDGSLDELFMRDRQPLIDAGYIEESKTTRSFVTSSTYYRLTDKGRARLNEVDPEGVAKRKATAERKAAREAAAVEKERLTRARREAQIARDVEKGTAEGLDPQEVRLWGLTGAREAKAKREAKAAEQRRADLERGVPEYTPGASVSEGLRQHQAVFVFGGGTGTRGSLMNRMSKDGITLEPGETEALKRDFGRYEKSISRLDQTNADRAAAAQRRDYIASIAAIEGDEYAPSLRQADVDVDAAAAEQARALADAEGAEKALFGTIQGVYQARGKRKTRQGVKIPQPYAVTPPKEISPLSGQVTRNLPAGAATDPRGVEVRRAALDQRRSFDELNKIDKRIKRLDTDIGNREYDIGRTSSPELKRERRAEVDKLRDERKALQQRRDAEVKRREAATARYSKAVDEYRVSVKADAERQEAAAVEQQRVEREAGIGKNSVLTRDELDQLRATLGRFPEQKNKSSQRTTWSSPTQYGKYDLQYNDTARSIARRWIEAIESGNDTDVSGYGVKLATFLQRNHPERNDLRGAVSRAMDVVHDRKDARKFADIHRKRGGVFETLTPEETKTLQFHTRAGLLDSPEAAETRLVEYRRTGVALPPSRIDTDEGVADNPEYTAALAKLRAGGPAKKKITPAKRGDLVVVTSKSRTVSRIGPGKETTHVELYEVASVNREGLVTRVKDLQSGHETTLASVRPSEKPLVVSADKVDVQSAKTSVRPRGYQSVDEIREAIRPYARKPAGEASARQSAPEAPKEPTPQAVKQAREALTSKITARVTREDGLAEVERQRRDEVKKDLDTRLEQSMGSDELVGRTAEVEGRLARHDRIVAERDSAVADLRKTAADDPDPARRKAAADLADSLRDMAIPDVTNDRKELENLRGDVDRLEAARRQHTASRTTEIGQNRSVQSAAEDAAYADLIEAFGGEETYKSIMGGNPEAARLRQEYLRNAGIRAIREHQVAGTRGRVEAMNETLVGMRTAQGQGAAKRIMDNDVSDMRQTTEDVTMYRYRADGARAELEPFAARGRARAEEQRRVAERVANSPEALDREDARRAGERLKAKLAGDLALLDRDLEERLDRRRLKKQYGIPGASKIKTLSWGERQVAESAIRRIEQAARTRADAVNNDRQAAAARAVMDEGDIRPATESMFQQFIARLAQMRGGEDIPAERSPDVLKLNKERDEALEAWRAIVPGNNGELVEDPPPELWFGLEANQQDRVVLMARNVGIQAARRLAAAYRQQ